MRLVPRRWSDETWVCSFRGHVAPAAWVRELRLDDRSLGIELGDGTRLCRCLRCDAWVHTEAPGSAAAYDVMPPVERFPRPRRGRALEDIIFLRVIAVERAIHAVIFGLFTLGLILARLDLHWLVRQAAELKDNTSRDASLDWFTKQVDRVVDINSKTISLLMITSALYCLSESLEAVGLWRGKRWAEYLTVLATAGFLPFEIRLLTERVTILRIAAMVVNLAILFYLVWGKRLFGLRGGRAALERELADSVDWDEIVTRPPTQPMAPPTSADRSRHHRGRVRPPPTPSH